MRILYYRCETCQLSYAVDRSDADLHVLTVKMTCPTDECAGTMELVVGQAPHRFSTISAKDLFAASRGRGLPKEKRCSPEALGPILLGKKIVGMEMEKVGDDRSVIDSLTVEGGKTIHFATSTRGATIYKVTEGPDV